MDFEVIDTTKEGIIEGSGDIGSTVAYRRGALIFAAGVSNSQNTDEYEFFREKLRLTQAIHTANSSKMCLFYFGSISCFFTVSRYTKHKEEMEQLIRDTCKFYNIIRIGNITWGNNPNTFINFIRNKKAKGEHVHIKDEWKYLIGRQELRLIVDSLPLIGRNEISVFGECKKVADII